MTSKEHLRSIASQLKVFAYEAVIKGMRLGGQSAKLEQLADLMSEESAADTLRELISGGLVTMTDGVVTLRDADATERVVDNAKTN